MSKGIYTALNRAHDVWREAPNEGHKYVYFEVMAEEEYGIKLIFEGDGYFEKREVVGAKIVDEQKYTAFLLRWL